MKDIFNRIEPNEKLDDKFLLLDEFGGFKPAKAIIKEIADDFEDKDGNFIQQFQTTGFESRLWELFLFSVFKENNFEIQDDYDRPDFHLLKDGSEIYVEATISTEKTDEKYTAEFINESIQKKDLKIQNELIDYYVIRMGSVLFSKLNKKYWELEWVKEKPLLFAITPSHNYIANFLPDSKIIEYLYGLFHEAEITEKGLESRGLKKTLTHTFNEKEIPSNFFSQENVENISAVIFTNNCDPHKFNRMGFQQGLVNDEFIIYRTGLAYDPTPNSTAKMFKQNVKPGVMIEEWKESVSVFHNPNAIHKIDKELFNGFRQVWLNENGELEGIIPDIFVYNSITAAALID